MCEVLKLIVVVLSSAVAQHILFLQSYVNETKHIENETIFTHYVHK